jgi:glycosyltransferase involved in cell wall biosynthesis
MPAKMSLPGEHFAETISGYQAGGNALMKIALVIDSLGSGGAQRQFVALANGLSERGHQIRIFCYHDLPFFSLELSSAVIQVVATGRRGWVRKAEILLRLAVAREEIVISFLDVPNALNLSLRFVRPGVRRIVSERNVDPGRLPIRRRVLLAMYNIADCIVANSRCQFDNLQKRKHLKNRARYIVNTVDTSKFCPRTSVAKIPETKILRGIVVANYANSKNPWLPINWLELNRNKEITFDWFGNTFVDCHNDASNLYNRAANYVKENALDNITLHGPRLEIDKIYHEFDFLCLPSFHEGTPNVICEAMACGLPVICSAVSDNPFLVEDGINGFLFDPCSVSSFGEAVNRLLLLSDIERLAIGSRNRQKAISFFSQERYIDAWEDSLLTCREQEKGG